MLGEWGFRRLTLTGRPASSHSAPRDRAAGRAMPRAARRPRRAARARRRRRLRRDRARDQGRARGCARDRDRQLSGRSRGRRGERASARVCDVELVEGELFAGLDGPFDLVVSNPPYVAPEEIDDAGTGGRRATSRAGRSSSPVQTARSRSRRCPASRRAARSCSRSRTARRSESQSFYAGSATRTSRSGRISADGSDSSTDARLVDDGGRGDPEPAGRSCCRPTRSTASARRPRRTRVALAPEGSPPGSADRAPGADVDMLLEFVPSCAASREWRARSCPVR